MTHLRNSIFSLPLFAEEAEVSPELQKEIDTCNAKYPSSKMKQCMKPFLDYCKFKDEDAARAKLFAKVDEKKMVRAESKLDNHKPTYESSGYLLSTLSSYVGVHVNAEKAEQALRMIIAVTDISSNAKPDVKAKEPVYVINALYQLADIYNSLPERSKWSPANAFFYLNLATAEPQVRAAIKGVFKCYNMMPENESRIDLKALRTEAERVRRIVVDKSCSPALAKLLV